MYRKVLMNAISSILLEHGFDTAEPLVLETLTEMLSSFLFEIGKSSRSYSELAGRSEPLAGDVILTLVNLGLKTNELESYARRIGKTVISPPVPSVQPKQLSILQAGSKAPHPSYIPNHLPVFPDPHAYIRTPTHKQPVTEYEAIREKSAIQKRDIERALNKFAARTSDTDSLFLCQDKDNLFPLIAYKPQLNTPPYLMALLPKDQVFEQEDEEDVRSSPQRKRPPAGKELEEAQKEVEIDSPYLLPVKLPPPKIKIKDLLAPPPQPNPSSMPPPSF
uniref:Transcription initiation factor TFIID subunit 8 n=1 Tax=Lygus hesperus TaxID=30085 RepID=A0A0A9Z8E4_LYGHE